MTAASLLEERQRPPPRPAAAAPTPMAAAPASTVASPVAAVVAVAAPVARPVEPLLVARSVPPTAAILVDHKALPGAPREASVTPGLHVIEAWWPDGRYTVTRLRIGRRGRHIVELRR